MTVSPEEDAMESASGPTIAAKYCLFKAGRAGFEHRLMGSVQAAIAMLGRARDFSLKGYAGTTRHDDAPAS